MEHMRSDMGGAGVVLGTLKAISELKLKVNVVGVIPSVENAIGSQATSQAISTTATMVQPWRFLIPTLKDA